MHSEAQDASVLLRDVNLENWKDVIALDVAPQQTQLVGPNVRSLAEAYVREDAVTFAIYSGTGDLVGFMMYVTEAFDGKRHIHRFMIDQKHQGKGYGWSALTETVRYIWNVEGYRGDIAIMFLTYNIDAERLYRRFGFMDTGQIKGDEKVFNLPYHLRVQYD